MTFRYRFWFTALIYVLAFSCYALDPVNSSVALVRWAQRLAGQHDLAATDHYLRWPFALATVLVASGAMLRTWGAAYLRPEVVHDSELRTAELVADGPYRYVRNPLYLGSQLVALGIGFLTSRLGLVVLVVGTLVHYGRLIRREEAELRAAQGERYRRYCAAVPQWIPAWRPQVGRGARRPQVWPAILGEQFMWLSALAMALFTATLEPPAFYLPVGAGLLVYVLRTLSGTVRRTLPLSAGASHDLEVGP